MTTVSQPYVYDYVNILGVGSGGSFTGDMSSHLQDMILNGLPNFTNPVINSDDVSQQVTVTGDVDLTTDEKTTLDGFVNRAADYFIITTDGGTTDLGNPATVSKPAGPTSSVTVTLQYKKGDGTDRTGITDAVSLTSPVISLDKTSGNFDSNGKFQFVLGAQLAMRGTAQIDIVVDSLAQRTLLASWT